MKATKDPSADTVRRAGNSYFFAQVLVGTPTAADFARKP